METISTIFPDILRVKAYSKTVCQMRLLGFLLANMLCAWKELEEKEILEL